MVNPTVKAILKGMESIDEVMERKKTALAEVWVEQKIAKSTERPFFKLDHQISSMQKEIDCLTDSYRILNRLKKNHESLLREEYKQQ